MSRALVRRKDSPVDLLARLGQQEIARVGPETARARGLTFRPAETGNYVSGTPVGSVNFASGKFAMIDDGLGFSLVPWRPVLERRLERHVSGIANPGGHLVWIFGRARGLSL